MPGDARTGHERLLCTGKGARGGVVVAAVGNERYGMSSIRKAGLGRVVAEWEEAADLMRR